MAGDELRATVVERDADGGVVLAFNRHDDEFAAALRHAGALALPPYIARPAGPLPEDSDDYQTIFAHHDGAVAAPTAGLHFTPALLEATGAAWRAAGHRHAACRRRHLPAGAYRRHHATPHACRTRRDHAASRSRDQCARVQRVVAVGTTSLRLLESAACEDGMRPAVQRRHHAVHSAGLPIPRGRSAADQLPSAALDAVHAGLRLCRHASGCARRTRMRSRRGIGSTPTAMRACWSRPIHPLPQGEGGIDVMAFAHRIAATDGARAPACCTTAHGDVADTCLHAGRHRRHGEGDDAGRGARHRRRHRAGQHLSPDAAAWRGTHRQARRVCIASWTGPDRS